MEVWLRKNMEENKLEELKKYLGDNLGCQRVIVKDIDV